jgi:hypothetical protein
MKSRPKKKNQNEGPPEIEASNTYRWQQIDPNTGTETARMRSEGRETDSFVPTRRAN